MNYNPLQRIKHVFLPEEPKHLQDQQLDYEKDIEWASDVTLTFHIQMDER